MVSPGELNAYDVLVADYVVFTKATLPNAQAEKAKSVPTTVPEKADESSDVGEEE